MGRTQTLGLPPAVDAAYLLLIGQISFLYVRVLFWLATVSIGSPGIPWDLEKLLIIAVLVIVPVVLLVNILSGWMSTRETFDEFEEYPNSLFLIELVLIVILFSLNNALALAAVPPDGKDLLASLLGEVTVTNTAGNYYQTAIVQVLPLFLYAFGAAICLAYVWWNRAHSRERRRITGRAHVNTQMAAHNRFLHFASLVQIGLFLLSYSVTTLVVELTCLGFWLAIWIWLNMQWILTSPLSPTASPGSPASHPR